MIPLPIASYMDRRRVLLIGGDCRPDQLSRLTEAFPHSTIEWVPTSERNTRTSTYRAIVERFRPGLLVCIFGLLRTQATKELRAICSSNGIPMAYVKRPTPMAIVAAVQHSRAHTEEAHATHSSIQR